MAIQSAVACSEAKDDGLLVSCQLMERVLVWVVNYDSQRSMALYLFNDVALYGQRVEIFCRF